MPANEAVPALVTRCDRGAAVTTSAGSHMQPALRLGLPAHTSPSTLLRSFLWPLAACTRSLTAWWTSMQCTRWRPLVSTALPLPACLPAAAFRARPVLLCSRAACVDAGLVVETACRDVVCTEDCSFLSQGGSPLLSCELDKADSSDCLSMELNSDGAAKQHSRERAVLLTGCPCPL